MAKQSTYWLFGTHAVQAALDNPEREILSVMTTSRAAERIDWGRHNPEIVSPEQITRKVGGEAVHQGVALQVRPLEQPAIQDVMHAPRLAILDQVTDPHNVGAILRSAAAFNIGALIMPKDASAPETGVMAKAACGALEIVPLIQVTNLAKTMKELKADHYWLFGMDGEAKADVSAVKGYDKAVIVLGAEGKGLRRLTAESCDMLVKIPMDEAMESLNVSNAAAIAFYAAH